MSDLVPVKHCVVCGESSPGELYRIRDLMFGDATEWSYAQCAACGHGFIDPQPTGVALGELYGGLYTPENLQAMEAIGNSWWEKRLHRIRIAAVRDGLRDGAPERIVDVGCGMGFYLRPLREAFPDSEVVGIELNEKAAGSARAIPGVRVLQQPFEEAELDPASVDVLSMNHLLEHMTDPAAAIDRAAELVRSGGVIEIEVPRGDGWGRRAFGRWWWVHLPPQHLHLFTRDGLVRLLADHGFPELVEVRTTSYPFMAVTTLVLFVRYTVGSRSQYANNWLVRGPVVLLGFAVLPWLLLFDLTMGPLLDLLGRGDVVTVVAKRG